MSVVSVLLTEALSVVFTTESEQKRERKQHILLGSIKGARARALASHRCGLGSSFDVDLDFLKVLRFLFPVPVVGPSAKDFSHVQRTKFTGGIFLL